MMNKLPWSLIYLRLALTVPAILFGVYGILGPPYIVLLAVAAATDYYDGVLARRLNMETAALRQWDSVADTIFFLGVATGMWLAYPAVFTAYAPGILVIIGLETIRYVVDFAKFRRGASYHAISAKVFGVSLLIATISIMGFGVHYPVLPIALSIGVLSELEGLCMSFLLRKWTYNVRHLGIALKMRNEK